eukprot:m.14837 g.14837  ORF g.14837 m.14837 type:complete len:415 (+) comp5222_c0_seq1:251-1495(+)
MLEDSAQNCSARCKRLQEKQEERVVTMFRGDPGKLPCELLVLVFECLDPITILTVLPRVCRLWRTCVPLVLPTRVEYKYAGYGLARYLRVALGIMCLESRLPLATWLVKEFRLTRDIARLEHRRSMLESVDSSDSEDEVVSPDCFGNSRVMQLCADHDQSALYRAVEEGHIPVAQWLVKTFSWSATDIRQQHHALLQHACCHGQHIRMVKWLVTMSEFTATDLRRMPREASLLLLSCKHGHLPLGQWLVSSLKLTSADARADANFALRWSCRNGHLHVAQWLVEKFELDGDDARSKDNFALLWACKNGFLHVAQWLVSSFNMTSADVIAADICSLRWSYQSGNLPVLKWLTSTFDLASADYFDAMRSAGASWWVSSPKSDRQQHHQQRAIARPTPPIPMSPPRPERDDYVFVTP